MFFSKAFKSAGNLKRLQNVMEKNFARNGPYNPTKYKDYGVPRTLPKNEEIYQYVRSIASVPNSPIRNVRNINPVRQSGPLPVHDGEVSMEDIRDIFHYTTVGHDFCYCQMDIDELMRRVPGLLRKEAEHIVKLGLTPQEQVDFAYIAYNIGLDVFYMTNGVFVARQVVTNSKGEKCEVLWNAQAYEDLAMLNVGFAPVMETMDYHWEIFLWGDPPIKPTNDMDLVAPDTWFEYECEMWGELNIIEDQLSIPEDIRPFPLPRHPNCRKELWRNQEALQEEIEMEDENWYPKDSENNIYQQSSWQYPKISK